MKNLFKITLAVLLLSSCNLDGSLEMDKVKDPEKAIVRIYEGFELESITKEDLDYDGNMDIYITGYDVNDNWVESYFIHNADLGNTYTFMNSDDYWEDYDDYGDYEIYENVEDYFYDVADYSSMEDIVYGDLNNDGLEDAIVISNYDSEGYQSIDAYLFIASEEGYSYRDLAEVHYPVNYGDYSAYKRTVIKDGYFTIELGKDEPYWDRFITFKFDEEIEDFILHKDGGTIIDEEGNLVREQVLNEDDFGTIYFYEFLPDNSDVFSLKKEFTVSNTREFLNALGHNRTIYLEEGVYELNDLSQLPKEARDDYNSSSDGYEFYEAEYYTYSKGYSDYESEIDLTLRDLRNTDIVGVGDVEMVVTDEFVSVLTFDNCEKVIMENIYLVHEVEGICGANVVDLFYCYEMEFNNCVFDGSGELGVYAEASIEIYFNDSEFTNCTSGGIDFNGSDATFETCNFKNNDVWYALVSAYEYSNLYFYDCSFSNNVAIETEYKKDPTYLFLIEGESYIYVDDYSTIADDNVVSELLNDRDYIDVEGDVRF